ncbi:hypothetical protein KIPB_014857, partial [Kipferlia bialata]
DRLGRWITVCITAPVDKQLRKYAYVLTLAAALALLK